MSVTAVELARLKFPSWNEWFQKHFGGIFREDEKSNFSGVFWMILGVLTTLLLIQPTELAVTVLLYLIVGDAFASLVGKRVGGPHWPKSPKRLSGSLACFLVCLGMGAAMLKPTYHWDGIIIGAFTATIVEVGYLPINDNFSIPAFTSLVFLLFYNLKPSFF